MYKDEIERRLRKADYLKLPKVLNFNSTYDNINDSQEQQKMLSIADKYGMKYIQFLKLKDNVNIEDILDKLNTINYQPNLPFTEGQSSIVVAEVTKGSSKKNFSVLANFYTLEEEWVQTEEKVKKQIPVNFRRTLWIDFDSERNILVISIDPIGDGVKISNDIPNYVNNIFEQYEINIFNYFNILTISKPIYDMIDLNVLRSTKLKTKDEISARSYEAITTARFDDLSDEDLYSKTKNKEFELSRMKMKHDELDVGLELFGQDIIKITNKINWKQSDDIKRELIQVL